MSVDNNIRAVEVLTEEFNKQNIEGMLDLHSTNFVHDDPEEYKHGLEGVKEFYELYFQAFPDIKNTIEDIIAFKNRVAVRYTITGTHNGPFLNINPTGKKINITSIFIYRFDSTGKIEEGWGLLDRLRMLEQLGFHFF